MLVGEVQRRETRITRLTAEAEHLRSNIAALDVAMALFDSRLDPRAGGAVKGFAGKYGDRGGLQRFLLAQVAAAGAQGVDTVTLTIQAASRFFVVIDSVQDRNTYRDTVSWTLRDLRRRGVLENGFVSRGGHTPSTWRMKSQSSLEALVAKAKGIHELGHA